VEFRELTFTELIASLNQFPADDIEFSYSVEYVEKFLSMHKNDEVEAINKIRINFLQKAKVNKIEDDFDDDDDEHKNDENDEEQEQQEQEKTSLINNITQIEETEVKEEDKESMEENDYFEDDDDEENKVEEGEEVDKDGKPEDDSWLKRSLNLFGYNY